MEIKRNTVPVSKKFAGCTAKIQTLINGRIILTVYDKNSKMIIHRECNSKEEAVQLLQLTGQQFQKVQETTIYVVKE